MYRTVHMYRVIGDFSSVSIIKSFHNKESSCDLLISFLTGEAANLKAESNVNNMRTLRGRVWRSRDGLGIARLTARRRRGGGDSPHIRRPFHLTRTLP